MMSRNSQMCLLISLDLLAELLQMIGMNLGLNVFWRMNLRHTIPLVAIILALLGTNWIRGGIRNSRNLSTWKQRNCYKHTWTHEK